MRWALVALAALLAGLTVLALVALGAPEPRAPVEQRLRDQLVKERRSADRLQRRYRREIRSLRRVARDVRYPTPAGNQRLGAAYFGDEWPCARTISYGETGGTFRHDVAYGFRYGEHLIYSGLAYGLGQARPGTKMLAYGADAASNPLTQWRWFRGYAEGRYGSVCGAAAHWTPARSW